jgi:hypothetical protein
MRRHHEAYIFDRVSNLDEILMGDILPVAEPGFLYWVFKVLKKSNTTI